MIAKCSGIGLNIVIFSTVLFSLLLVSHDVVDNVIEFKFAQIAMIVIVVWFVCAKAARSILVKSTGHSKKLAIFGVVYLYYTISYEISVAICIFVCAAQYVFDLKIINFTLHDLLSFIIASSIAFCSGSAILNSGIVIVRNSQFTHRGRGI